ncbi:hypothetical protein C3425_24085 [Citrobacter braakii]|nr:hypothetical protein C3423_24250 [Citrobacter braakii]POT34056.1 hypothetical protein C3431_24070 [Citrobacter braakii]POT38881.1 hypothetical protein C3425_24085 [Citrobacter braakii]POU80424.1 hypothetical protein C3426_24105 [Citrobacter braakii]POV06400.1 hypothetical protein C3427_24300 [Citrobacter braakii]
MAVSFALLGDLGRHSATSGRPKECKVEFLKKYSAYRMYDGETDHLSIRNAMSGKFLTNLSAKVRAELKQNLKNNAVYKRHRWSLSERAQVCCSTHYL